MTDVRNRWAAKSLRFPALWARTLSVLLLLVLGCPAHAEVEMAFYSKDLARSFPHAFVHLTGTVESSGRVIDDTYGFTPHQITLSMLGGPVEGMVGPVSSAYRERSDRHFALQLSETDYRAVMGVVERWRRAPQPSYYLNGRNCVNFVQEIAAVVGLSAPDAPRLMKKPKRYLMMLAAHNAGLIRRWSNRMPADNPLRAVRRAPNAASLNRVQRVGEVGD